MQLIRAGLTRRLVCCGLVLAVCGLGLAPPAHADGCVDASELIGVHVTCTVMQQAQPAQQGMPAGQGAPGIPAAEPVQPGAPAQPGAPVAEPTPEKTCWDILATAPPGTGCKHNGRRIDRTTPQPIEEEIPAEPAEPGIDIAGSCPRPRWGWGSASCLVDTRQTLSMASLGLLQGVGGWL